MGTVLTTRVTDIEQWTDLKQNEYLFIRAYGTDELCSIIFKCPGCNTPIAISNQKDQASWSINFEKLTATPSILHKRDGYGCGWHGYLTDGKLEGRIE